MSKELFAVTWANSRYFMVLIPLVIIALGLLVRRYLWQKSVAEILEGKGTSFLRHFSLSRKMMKTVLLSLALLFLVLSLGRPQREEKEQEVLQEGRDVLIALDISRSMLAQDLKPSRLAFAKKKIEELVGRLKTERLALMLFSGDAFIQCPFTTDTGAFLSFLEFIDVELISSGTTALDKAILKTIETFEQFPMKKQRIMIIYTDGEDFSPNLAGLEQKAKEVGLHIYTVGIGTQEGAPIPLYDENGVQQGYQKDEKGGIVISRLHEALLAKIAQQTGADYIHATENDSDVKEIVSDVERFEKEQFDKKTLAIKEDTFSLFALLSFILLLLDWIL